MGFSSLIEIFVSAGVDVAGNGAIHSGKGMMMAGARKLGWSSGGSAGRTGKRFAGHSLARRSLGNGRGGNRGRLGTYDPAADYKQATMSAYHKSKSSGSGMGGSGMPQKQGPAHLFGRPGFDKGVSPLGRSEGHRYARGKKQNTGSWSKTPRGNINF